MTALAVFGGRLRGDAVRGTGRDRMGGGTKGGLLQNAVRGARRSLPGALSHGVFFRVVVSGGRDAGRLYVDRWEREIRIMDIALLPEHHGQGAGNALLKKLQEEAAATARVLSIHVERFNPALRLYHRLGFVAAEDKGVYLLLHWTPPGAAVR